MASKRPSEQQPGVVDEMANAIVRQVKAQRIVVNKGPMYECGGVYLYSVVVGEQRKSGPLVSATTHKCVALVFGIAAYIHLLELRNALSSLGLPADTAQTMAVLQRFDHDGSGRVTFKELNTALRSVKMPPTRALRVDMSTPDRSVSHSSGSSSTRTSMGTTSTRCAPCAPFTRRTPPWARPWRTCARSRALAPAFAR